MFSDIISIVFCDILSIILSKLVYPITEVHHNTRWFFIHFMVNIVVTVNTFSDLVFCIGDNERCHILESSPQAFYAMRLAVLLHIYHMVMFTDKMTDKDWTHHLSLCSINIPLLYIYNRKLHAAGTFFLTGFPGMIDYFLLWCVQMGFLDPMIEKKAYINIITWIRSPGCLYASFLSIRFLVNSDNIFDIFMAFFGLVLNFWNGQYYMMLTCIDYGKKLKEISYKKDGICATSYRDAGGDHKISRRKKYL